MHELLMLLVSLLLWILLLALCRRMLVTMVGAPVVRRLERPLRWLLRIGLRVLALPVVLPWNLARLHFRRGRPMLRAPSAHVIAPPPLPRTRPSDRDLFLPGRRRRP